MQSEALNGGRVSGRRLSRLRLERVTRGLRLLDVSGAIGVSESRLSRIERGEVAPSEREREALARFFSSSLFDEGESYG